VYKTQTWAQTT